MINVSTLSFICLFEELSIKVPCSFLTEMFVFLLVNCEYSLCIPDTSTLTDLKFQSNFFQSVSVILIFLFVSLHTQKS
jgi:hypothetical protein